MSAVVEGKSGFRAWLNKRLPVDQFVADQLTGYYAPKNFNIWYFFGSLALLVFVMQIVTGIFVTMHYKPGELTAFNSVEYLMREVPYGWLLRYLHSTGASCFFIVVYLHMTRALLYGSYKAPRELLWVIGMLIYFALMAEAFMGYVLPWGNMSFWGAQVIINIFNTIPVIGPDLVEWIRGDYAVADSTLNRFFSLHVIAMPFLLALLIALHLVALRQVGSSNPDGIEIKEKLGPDGKPLDGIPFHPYYTLKDIEPANPMSTPDHIAPTWYFTPYYAILRAIPDQRLGALAFACSVLAFVFLPWLDRAKNKSIRYRGIASKLLLGMFFVVFLTLMWLGLQPAEPLYVTMARVCIPLYFAFFILLPFVSKADGNGPVPERVTYHAH
jgi:ubiquinol-cytochrome c reductase cytochrome b subunit